MLTPCFSRQDLTTIAANNPAGANNGIVQAVRRMDGAKGYRFINTTAMWMTLLDEFTNPIDILPPAIVVEGSFDEETRTVTINFDPATSGVSGAYTGVTNHWQVYSEASSQPLPRRTEML